MGKEENAGFQYLAESYPKWVENTMGKGEIARYEQFLLFPQCFQKAFFPGASKGVIVWEWVKQLFNCVLQRLSVWRSLKHFVGG